MKNRSLVICSLFLCIALFSCKKDEEETPVAPDPAVEAPLFIKFTLDGEPKNITGTRNSLSSGLGSSAYTSSGFFTFKTDIDISISMPLDSIRGENLDSLIGKKIPVGSCGGCPTNMELRYTIKGDGYRTSESNNPLPDNYFKITSVTYLATVQSPFGDEENDQYIITGEFNVSLSYGTEIKNAPDGTFKLIFQDVNPY